MTAYQVKTGAKDVGLDFDLGSRHLRLVCAPAASKDPFGAAFEWNAKTGCAVTFRNGSVSALADNGTTNMMQLCEGGTITFDKANYSGWIKVAARDAKLVVTNGAKLYGGYWDYDQAKNTEVLVTGTNTVWDMNGFGLRVGGRGNVNAFTNFFYVADGAVITNFGSVAEPNGYNGIGTKGTGCVIEFRTGARGYCNPGRYMFSLAATGGDGQQFRVLSGAQVWVNGLGVGRYPANDVLCEVAGKGSLLYCRTPGKEDPASYWAYQGGRNARMWVHDFAVVTNEVTTSICGIKNLGTDAALDVEDHAVFYTMVNIQIGSDNNLRSRLKVDGASFVSANRCTMGRYFPDGVTPSSPQTNLLWVGSGSKLEVRDYLLVAKGAASTLVVSNGTVAVSNNYCRINGTNTVVFAGSKPRLAAKSFVFDGDLVFDVPGEGYDTSDAAVIEEIRTTSSFNLPTKVPTFRLSAYARGDGGQMTLIRVGSQINATAETLENWRQAAEDACQGFARCKLEISGDKKSLVLTVKRRRGFAVIVR